MGRTFLDIDMARAADLLGMERRLAEAFRDLERGHFMALGPALSRRPLSVCIGATETQPPNTTPRLMPLPEAVLEDAHAVILAAPPETVRPQRRPLLPPAPDLLSQLMAAAPAGADNRVEATEGPPNHEQLAERRARLERILSAILADPEAGFRAIGVLYQDFLVRCRIEGLGAGGERANAVCARRDGLCEGSGCAGDWAELRAGVGAGRGCGYCDHAGDWGGGADGKHKAEGWDGDEAGVEYDLDWRDGADRGYLRESDGQRAAYECQAGRSGGADYCGGYGMRCGDGCAVAGGVGRECEDGDCDGEAEVAARGCGEAAGGGRWSACSGAVSRIT